MRSFRAEHRRRERHRALGFFDKQAGTGTVLLSVVCGVVVTSSAWHSGVCQAVVAFILTVIGVAVVIKVLARRRERERMDAWERLFASAGLGGVEVSSIDSSPRGLLLELTVPPTVTFRQLQRETERVEAAAGLGRGDVRVERDADIAETAWMHAANPHGAARDEPAYLALPPDPGPGLVSVTRPLAVGYYDDGEPCTLQLGHSNVLVVGNSASHGDIEWFFRVLIAQLARCNDALIWIAAPGWAREVAPWLQTLPPVLDWIALDADEAQRMLTVATKVAQHRGRHGPAGDHLQPTAEFPAVLLLAPEADALFGRPTSTQHRRSAELAFELAHQGPREAVSLVLGGRTDSVIPSGLRGFAQHCGIRIGLGLTHEPAASTLFPDAVRPSWDALSEAGTMLVHQSPGRTMPATLYEFSWDESKQVAQECERRRPILEDPAAELDATYEDRWKRWDSHT